jgi:putative sigma-54 modulation protein
MQIVIQGSPTLTELDLPSHINTRLYFAIGRFAPRVQRVSVKLRDANAQKGGVDKHCCMIVALKNGDELIVEKKSAKWTLAVNDAANCAGRAVARAIRLELDTQRTDRRRALI